MNEGNLNPEIKRLEEIREQSRKLTENGRHLSDPPEVRERAERYRAEVLRGVIAKAHPDKSAAWREKRLTEMLGKPAPSQAEQNRKTSRAAAAGRGTERKELTKAEAMKGFKEANDQLIARIKSYRFAGVQGIQVR